MENDYVVNAMVLDGKSAQITLDSDILACLCTFLQHTHALPVDNGTLSRLWSMSKCAIVTCNFMIAVPNSQALMLATALEERGWLATMM